MTWTETPDYSNYVYTPGTMPQYSITYATPASWTGAVMAHELQAQAKQLAEFHVELKKQEQRIQHLTERMALHDDDIEKLHKMIGRMNGSPTLWPYKDETLRRV